MTENEKELNETVVESDNGLKELFVRYIGEKLKPENGEITVEMCVEVFAEEFPEFLLLVAQENFIRGYEQALNDIEQSEQVEKTEEIDASQ